MVRWKHKLITFDVCAERHENVFIQTKTDAASSIAKVAVKIAIIETFYNPLKTKKKNVQNARCSFPVIYATNIISFETEKMSFAKNRLI